ncbi:sialic acid synthase [Folsomia candida]|uniref:Sialic acid synthase n=1 Tax=Folsomia candida TaxID=158441 RepID=A0A226EWQ2_FOLCA|nr:sialic acid synthase [Folsomia candida]OXA61261.1 Sialic acid synthase [Folsomia candida]
MPRVVRGLPIGDGYPCFIIAEIGQNHQGDANLAKELILKAKECGANCVKLQKSSLPDKFTKAALEREYVSENSFGRTYGEHKEHLELSGEEYRDLQRYANQLGVMFSASAMDKVSADLLIELDVPFIKIGSGDTNNYQMLEHIAKSGKPIILSTGMQEFDTVKTAVSIITKHHPDNLVLLHCVSAYPTPLQDVNLSLINLYKDTFSSVPIGYSGHELGIAVSIGAVALGAKVIERHFTLDKTLKGTDHRCSLDPDEFLAMVEGIRQVETALIGEPHKTILASELPCNDKLGKSLVAVDTIREGDLLDIDNIVVKVSYPKGLQPERLFYILGKMVNKTIEADTPIKPEYIINLDL